MDECVHRISIIVHCVKLFAMGDNFVKSCRGAVVVRTLGSQLSAPRFESTC